jgi:outer membrane protein OmpA-like peptidoglycan-associated protein
MFEISLSPNESIMKKKLTLILFILTIAFNLKVSATNGQLDEKNSNYVVIGAFSIPKNAVEFTENAKKQNYQAHYLINPNRKLFYVFVLHTGDRKIAFDEANKLREGSPFNDTWVYTGLLGDDLELGKGSDLNPVTGEKIIQVKSLDNLSTTVLAKEAVENNTGGKLLPVPDPMPVSTVEEAEEGSKKFLFKIFTADRAIQGDVDVMDLDKTTPRKIASYRGNEPVNVKPGNKSGNISLVCEVFGYRKIQTVTNFNEPQATEGITVEENKIVVPFELVRLKKGDYAVMYNVYFYKDAGIMRPESKYEVTSLLEMLKENPQYKIRIHGHTNGNAHGKVISMGDSKNFFGMTADVKNGFGSAKKLSEERAKVIQSYLIQQGVDPARTQIKAWGGKKPVYEEDHVLAQANVRVEIEILED